jgi:hypothetical protein
MEDNTCARGASPILRNSHHDDYRHRRALNPIFTDIFPIWNSRTGKPRVNLPFYDPLFSLEFSIYRVFHSGLAIRFLIDIGEK